MYGLANTKYSEYSHSIYGMQFTCVNEKCQKKENRIKIVYEHWIIISSLLNTEPAVSCELWIVVFKRVLDCKTIEISAKGKPNMNKRFEEMRTQPN